MRKFLIITFALVAGGLGYMVTHDPPLRDAPSIAQICRAEASPSKQDQDDCRAKHAFGAAFGTFKQQDDAKQINARR